MFTSMEDVKESQFTEKQPATPVVDPIQDGDSEATSDSESAELNRKLGESLSDIAQRGGVTSWAAKRMVGIGKWLEREVDHRKQTIGGIDNMWLLMSDATDCDFNPVRAHPHAHFLRHHVLIHDAGLRVYLYTSWDTHS